MFLNIEVQWFIIFCCKKKLLLIFCTKFGVSVKRSSILNIFQTTLFQTFLSIVYDGNSKFLLPQLKTFVFPKRSTPTKYITYLSLISSSYTSFQRFDHYFNGKRSGRQTWFGWTTVRIVSPQIKNRDGQNWQRHSSQK